MKVQNRSYFILSLLFCLFSFTATAQISLSDFWPFKTSESTPATAKQRPPAEVAIPTGPIAEMTFDYLSYDFGTIISGDKVSYVYTFTNTGKEALVIANAKGSCGCTVPSWPKEPIAPGEKATIEVSFDSSNKSGNQAKRVTITANTNPAQTFLTIKGVVLKQEEVDKEHALEESFAIEDAKKALEIDPKLEEKVQFEKASKNCIAIFPNPTSDFLKLDLVDNVGKEAIIRIYSSKGQVMIEKKIKSVEGLMEFDVRNYIAGTYIANVQIDGQAPIAHCFVVL